MYRNDVTYYIRLEEDTARLMWGNLQGAALRKLREEAELSRHELAAIMGRGSEPLIQKLENASSKAIDSSIFLSICSALDADPTEFGYRTCALSN
jgi:transcriptional regulator with XRE-family HTH domain